MQKETRYGRYLSLNGWKKRRAAEGRKKKKNKKKKKKNKKKKKTKTNGKEDKTTSSSTSVSIFRPFRRIRERNGTGYLVKRKERLGSRGHAGRGVGQRPKAFASRKRG